MRKERGEVGLRAPFTCFSRASYPSFASLLLLRQLPTLLAFWAEKEDGGCGGGDNEIPLHCQFSPPFLFGEEAVVIGHKKEGERLRLYSRILLAQVLFPSSLFSWMMALLGRSPSHYYREKTSLYSNWSGGKNSFAPSLFHPTTATFLFHAQWLLPPCFSSKEETQIFIPNFLLLPFPSFLLASVPVVSQFHGGFSLSPLLFPLVVSSSPPPFLLLQVKCPPPPPKCKLM